MKGNFGGWKLEDQPAAAGVDVRVVHYVAEERAVGFRVAAVDDDMCSRDGHGATIASDQGTGRRARVEEEQRPGPAAQGSSFPRQDASRADGQDDGQCDEDEPLERPTDRRPM